MNIPAKHSVDTTSLITIIFFATKDVMRILSSDDVLVLKKHMSKSPSKESLVNLYLNNLYWSQFKHKLLIQEKLIPPPMPQIKNRSQKTKSQQKRIVTNTELLLGRYKPVQELKFFKATGTTSVNSIALGMPQIVGNSKLKSQLS